MIWEGKTFWLYLGIAVVLTGCAGVKSVKPASAVETTVHSNTATAVEHSQPSQATKPEEKPNHIGQAIQKPAVTYLPAVTTVDKDPRIDGQASLGSETTGPAYVVDGLYTPLKHNETQQLNLALSLSMKTQALWDYVTEKFKTSRGTIKPLIESDDRTGQLPPLTDDYVKIRAMLDCGDETVLRCELMKGYSDDVDLKEAGVTPMLWRWNVKALVAAEGYQLSQTLGIVISGVTDTGEVKQIDVIPDIPLRVDIAPPPPVVDATTANHEGEMIPDKSSVDGWRAYIESWAGLGEAIAGLIAMVAGWYLMIARRVRTAS